MAIGDRFTQMFKPDRGDIVYGRSDFRADYLNDAKKVFGDRWMVIDDYNNASILSAGGLYEGDQGVRKIATEAAQQYAVEPRAAHSVPGYLQNLYSHTKYNPYRAINAGDERLAKEHGVDTDTSIQWLIIRRACKFGLEWVTENTATASEIHFVIDGLDMADITQKRPLKTTGRQEAAVPITTSELCSVYRKWHRPSFSHRIRFYLNKLETEPPWLDQRTCRIWQEYGRQRYEKYRGILESKLEAAFYSPHNRNWENAVRTRLMQIDAAIRGFVNQRQYYAATDQIKQELERLEPAWRREPL